MKPVKIKVNIFPWRKNVIDSSLQITAYSIVEFANVSIQTAQLELHSSDEKCALSFSIKLDNNAK